MPARLRFSFLVLLLSFAAPMRIFAAPEQLAREAVEEFITPAFTFSPDGRYGITLLVFHEGNEPGRDARKNEVIEVKTNRVVATLNASPGYDRPLNHRETAPPLWSEDSSVLLWKVDGKWFPDALVLLKLNEGKELWQLDLMQSAQRAILERTKTAAPQKYAAAKKANAGSGSAFPEASPSPWFRSLKSSPFPSASAWILRPTPKASRTSPSISIPTSTPPLLPTAGLK